MFFVGKNNTNLGCECDNSISWMLFLTEVAWLVKANVKGTVIHPKFRRELESWEGTAQCGSSWDVSQTPAQFYLQGTQALWVGTVINTHLVWCEKSVSLLQLHNSSLPQQPSPAGSGLWGFSGFHACIEISFLPWRGQSACQRFPGV